jgi:hypothetical protein
MMGNKQRIKNLPAKYVVGFMDDVDSRTQLGKRLSIAFNSIVSDCGGLENLSYCKRALVERFAYLEEFLRRIEEKLAQDPVKQSGLLGKWVQAVNSMTGLARTLGLGDKSKQDFIDAVLYADDNDESEDKGANNRGEGTD